jgi:hypothetical protein
MVGPMISKQTETLEFPYYGIIIVKLEPSCGCSDTHDDKERGRVVVKYTAQDIPPQAMHKEAVKVEKKIIVKYYVENAEQIPANLQELTLTFTATVHHAKRK